MIISFGDDAADAFKHAVTDIRRGWTVALLGDGEEPGQAGTTEGRLHAVGLDGVAVRVTDNNGKPTGELAEKPWEEIARVHVY